jgi:hypothetical protein
LITVANETPFPICAFLRGIGRLNRFEVIWYHLEDQRLPLRYRVRTTVYSAARTWKMFRWVAMQKSLLVLKISRQKDRKARGEERSTIHIHVASRKGITQSNDQIIAVVNVKLRSYFVFITCKVTINRHPKAPFSPSVFYLSHDAAPPLTLTQSSSRFLMLKPYLLCPINKPCPK